jgi:DNA-binding response OmpR family regulator
MEKKQVKVMVIEDDKFLLKAYEIKFKQSKINAILARDGATGLSFAEKESPSLIILDLMLPKMNGFEILEKLKNSEALKNIPVIAVSNLGQKKDMKRALELGAKEYLIKTNYSLDEIIEKVKKYLD